MNLYEKNKVENAEILFRELKLSSINNNIKDLKTSFNNRLKKDYIKLLTFLVSSNCLIGSYNVVINNEFVNKKYDLIRLQKESYAFFNDYVSEYTFTSDDVLYIYFDWVMTNVYNDKIKEDEFLNQRVVHKYSFENLKDGNKLLTVSSLSDLILLLGEPEVFVEEVSDYSFINSSLPKVIIDNEAHLLSDANIFSYAFINDNSGLVNHLYEVSKLTSLFIIVFSAVNFLKYKISKEERIKTEAFLRVQLKELNYLLKLSKKSKTGVSKDTFHELQKLGFLPNDLICSDIISYEVVDYLEYLSNTVEERYNLLLSDDVPYSELEVIRKHKFK